MQNRCLPADHEGSPLHHVVLQYQFEPLGRYHHLYLMNTCKGNDYLCVVVSGLQAIGGGFYQAQFKHSLIQCCRGKHVEYRLQVHLTLSSFCCTLWKPPQELPQQRIVQHLHGRRRVALSDCRYTGYAAACWCCYITVQVVDIYKY